MASVAVLVEDVVRGQGVDPKVHRTAVAIADAGRVRLLKSGPLRVVAEVGDGAPVTVILRARVFGQRLSVSAGSETGSGWTPVTLAAAVEAWRRAPNRRF